MTGRRSLSGQRRAFVAGAALVFLVAWHAAPATASSNTPPISGDVTESVNDLDAVSAPTRSLERSVAAESRKAFKERAASLADNDREPAGSKRPAITTRVPGISDEQLARYKRQMYRKDI